MNKSKFRILIGIAAVAVFTCLAFPHIARAYQKRCVAHHFREFARIRETFNDFDPSFTDKLVGIRNSDDKLKYHLERLVDWGALKHKTFVFTDIPYTSESFHRIWQRALVVLPEPVEMRGNWYDEGQPEYGEAPIILDVWCAPHELKQWSQFVESENVGT
ncbi:MAG: hypothetical protein R3C18_22745 [Planctomycetaceae bacterium]